MTVLTLMDMPSWLSALKWPYHEIMLQRHCVFFLVDDGKMSDVLLRYVAGIARLPSLEVFAILYRRRLVSRSRGCSDLYPKI